jgi:hypothetical protein
MLEMSWRFAVNTDRELEVRCEYRVLGQSVGYRSDQRGKRIRRFLKEEGKEMSARPWDWNRNNNDDRRRHTDDRRQRTDDRRRNGRR